jgi:hypothetical protein
MTPRESHRPDDGRHPDHRLSHDPADHTGDPLPSRLAHQLTEKLRQAGKGDQVITPSDFARVAQTYELEMPPKRDGLEFTIAECYRPESWPDDSNPRASRCPPFSLCIRTTPDRFLLNAFGKTPAKQPIFDFYDFKPDPDHRSLLTRSEP